MMLLLLSPIVVAAATSTPVPAPQLTPQQEMALTCSAAFATTATAQASGHKAALAYPPLAERGREFFVRASAKVMEETGISRVELRARLSDTAAMLKDDDKLKAVMPACLQMLDESGI